MALLADEIVAREPLGSAGASGNTLERVTLREGRQLIRTAVVACRPRDPIPLRGDLLGAARFLDALVSEVMPQVEARHRADAADRTLVGHSFGGLFGLVTLFRQPSAFRRYLIISPSLWWDDRVILRHEQAWADNHDNLPARLFIGVGGREQAAGGGWKNEGFPDEAIAAVRQVDNCRELCARLDARRYPGLSVECVVLDGEYHLTVGAAAITRGLISLFSGSDIAVDTE